MSKIIALIAIALLPVSLAAQNPASTPERQLKVIDTIPTADESIKIVIYANNTWSYVRTSVDENAEGEAFRKNWINNQIFAYRNIDPRTLPESIELKLINDFNDYHLPIKGRIISKYGRRGRRNHNGVDIPLTVGEPVYAVFAGKVRYAQFNTGGYGNLVIIRHENGLETYYAHLTRCNVQPNDYVPAGAVIGFGGSTGRSRGPHLHFECRYSDQTFDPEHIIDFASGDLRYQTFALERSFFNINSHASENIEDIDYEEALLAANSNDGEITSEVILHNIAEADKKKAAVQAAAKPSSDPLYYTIRKGDTLSKIARQYGTTVKKLCQINKISENTIIRDGRKLRVR